MRKLLIAILFVAPALTIQAAEGTENLIDLYQAALGNDPRWAAAKNANLAAQEFSVQGKALLLPTVTLDAEVNHSETNVDYVGTGTVFRNAGRESFDGRTYAVQITQPIFNLSNFAQYQQSKIQVTLADKELILEQQNLMVRTAQVYFDVLLAQDKIDLIGAQKKAIVRQLEQAKANFEVGTATITDVDDAQARYDLIVSKEISLINELAVKQNAVRAVIGRLPQTLESVRPDFETRSPEPNNMDKWVELAEQNNLELNIQMQAFEIASKNVEQASAGHLPTLNAVGSYTDAYGNGGVSGFGNDLQASVVGLQLHIPIYQGGAVSSQVRQAVANKQKAQDDVETARRKAEFDAREAFLSIASGVAEVKANEQALVSSQSQLDSTTLGYEVGIRTSVDVLNTQQQYYLVKRDLLEARYRYLLSTLRLKSATGLLNEADLADVNQHLLAKK